MGQCYQVFSNQGLTIVDTTWSAQAYALPAFFNNKAAVQVDTCGDCELVPFFLSLNVVFG